MREILFRGKTYVENEWVEGDLGHCPDGRPFILFWNDDGSYTVTDVDPATVGQYTGLTDKNGVKIFENLTTGELET